jgi:hypothetical protein
VPIKKNKHDLYLENLCEILKPKYDYLMKNISIYSYKNENKKRTLGEIDILAKKNNQYHVYEVKCSYRIIKARHQLKKIKKLVPNIKKTFFYCGESDSIEQIII